MPPTEGLEIITIKLYRPRLGFLGAPIPAPAGEVRQFSDEALQASIDKLLDSLPADSKAAEVQVGVDAHGVQVVGVFKTPGGWSILGGVSYGRDGVWGGTVAARKVWS